MDSLLWFHRLERIALVEVAFSMLACIGAAEQSYNVSLGMFLLYSAYSRVGKINATSGILHLLSFVADIVILTVYGDAWAVEKHAYAFSMAIIIVNLFVKAVALLVIILIYGELGNTRIPIQYHHLQQPLIHQTLRPQQLQQQQGQHTSSSSMPRAHYGDEYLGEEGELNLEVDDMGGVMADTASLGQGEGYPLGYDLEGAYHQQQQYQSGPTAFIHNNPNAAKARIST